MTVELNVGTVAELVGQEPISGYKLIKVLNELTGVDRPTQMGYNYIRNELIETNESGKIEPRTAREWIVKFVEKNHTE